MQSQQKIVRVIDGCHQYCSSARHMCASIHRLIKEDDAAAGRQQNQSNILSLDRCIKSAYPYLGTSRAVFSCRQFGLSPLTAPTMAAEKFAARIFRPAASLIFSLQVFINNLFQNSTDRPSNFEPFAAFFFSLHWLRLYRLLRLPPPPVTDLPRSAR